MSQLPFFCIVKTPNPAKLLRGGSLLKRVIKRPPSLNYPHAEHEPSSAFCTLFITTPPTEQQSYTADTLPAEAAELTIRQAARKGLLTIPGLDSLYEQVGQGLLSIRLQVI